MNKLLYLALWYFQIRFLKRRKPLQTVLFINNECNLRCKHCCVDKDTKRIVKSYEQIKDELVFSYNLGSRFVDFEGGEPTLWHDDEGRNINDLIKLSKEIGFFSATVTTNAQNPINFLNADSVWVSLDGLRDGHNSIRGENAFENAVSNIEKYEKNNLSINMVINRLNQDEVESTIKFAAQNPHIRSISLNFHTPYNSSDDLCVDNKNEIIDKIIALKKQGYPIMNTVSGLNRMKKNQDGRYCWITNFIMPDGSRWDTCQGKDAGMCEKCGLCMAGEMENLYRFSFETILAGMKLRLKNSTKI